MNFKFPEMLFDNVRHADYGSYWYNTRWTGTFFAYISFHTIPKIYSFFTGNALESIFFTLGISVSFILISISIVLTFYLKQIFNIKILSKYFIFFLAVVAAMPIVIDSISLSNKTIAHFIKIHFDASTIGNYSGSTLVLLLALFPYWRYCITDKWDDWYNNNKLKVLYYFIIILASFSGPAITAFYFSISFVLLFIIALKNKSIDVLKDKMTPPLFASIILSSLVLLLERKYVSRVIDFNLTEKIIGIQSSLIVILAYTSVFLITALLPIILIFLFNKSTKKSDIIESVKNDVLLKKIFMALIFCYSCILVYLVIASVKNAETIEAMVKRGYGSAFYSVYSTLPNTFLILSFSISFVTMMFYLKSAFIKAILCMILVSHPIFYISYYPEKDLHIKRYDFYNYLYMANKEKNGDNIIYLDEERYNYYKSKLWLDVAVEFSKEFDIVDKNVTVMKKENLMEDTNGYTK